MVLSSYLISNNNGTLRLNGAGKIFGVHLSWFSFPICILTLPPTYADPPLSPRKIKSCQQHYQTILIQGQVNHQWYHTDQFSFSNRFCYIKEGFATKSSFRVLGACSNLPLIHLVSTKCLREKLASQGDKSWDWDFSFLPLLNNGQG